MELAQCEIRLKEYEKLIGTKVLHKSKSHSIFIQLIHCVPNFEINNDNLYHIRVVYLSDNFSGSKTEELDDILANYLI
jgi:hypothetical protein